MKIDILVRWLSSKDAVGTYAWNLAQALRDLGAGVCLFTSDSEENNKAGLGQNEGVFPIIKEWRVKEVITALRKVENNRDWLCFQYVPQMYGQRGICWQVGDILFALKKEFRYKIAVTFHEIISSWGIGLKDIFLASITRLQAKRILSVIDLAITTCARYKDILQYLSSYNLPVAVIPIGSNIEPILITPEELLVLRRQIFPEGSKILGYFGRLSPFRNLPFALQALKRARQQGLDAWLYLIGNLESSNSRLFKELMQSADKLGVKPYIVVSGELSEEDLSKQLKIVDVFIFPQRDGISTRNTTLMAALAHGLPIVSFKPQAGNFDNFHIPCAKFVDIGNKEGFIEAAVECLKKSGDLSRIASLNSDYYYQHFSWPIIAKRYLEALGAQ